MELTYTEPAKRWGEALPLGNGHMGAMVYGGWEQERVDLSENTFFSGADSDENNRPGAPEAFARMRALAAKGEYDRVHEEAEGFIGVRKDYGTNLPVGYLYIDLPLGERRAYERGLDISGGTAWCVRSDGEKTIREEVRISHPDNALALELVSDVPVDFSARVKLYNQEDTAAGNGEGLSFVTRAHETMHCDRRTGVLLAGAIRAETDGEARAKGDAVCVTGSTRTVLYLAMESNFGGEEKSGEELLAAARSRAGRTAKKPWEKFLEDHARDMEGLTKGMTLELDGTDGVMEKLPLLFQYGRYLLFCSSRGDSKLPAHLQGIWNDNVACRIGWTCDMHLDINTQMNYWHAEFSGLSECASPLFSWIQKRLVPKGEQTARKSYGRSGWAAELVSNAWGFAAPYWASPIAPCPTGGVWILTHMWEHYLYTRDIRFLREEAFPVIEGAAAFFREYVFETEEGCGCGPSISPENSFLYQGKPRQISNSCTYEVLMIRELFEIYQKAADILALPQKERFQDIGRLLEKLPPYRILDNGCIAEWEHDLPEADPQHRHTSHLLGLFPFAQITPEETPKLCEAAERTIGRKLTPPENWEDTGWARSMLMLYEARLGHGDQAYAHIRSMAEHLLEPNGMVYHPPTRGAGAFDHVYELDGNTGLCACLGEMLIQSHGGVIRLLPALPGSWRSGRVRNFCARGGVRVSMEWSDGRLTNAVFEAPGEQSVEVRCGGESRVLHLKKSKDGAARAEFACDF